MSIDGKIKILHLIDIGGQGGAEQVLFNLIEKLGQEHFEHHVILPNEGWLYDRLLRLYWVKISIYNGDGRFNIQYIRYLTDYFARNQIQIVHSHLLGTSLYASLAGFLSRVPVVCTFHGYVDLRSDDKLQNLKMNLIGLLARQIVAVSEGLKEYLAGRMRIGKRKLVTIYNGINLDNKRKINRFDARKRIGFSEDDILIGSIGNVKPVKCYDTLLRVADIVTKKYTNSRFLIAGNTDSDIYFDLLRQRNALSLNNKVVFLGYQDNIYDFIQMLDVFLLTSSSEGFSLATIEAMHLGVPVVATRSGGPQEIITHNINGLLTAVGDEVALAQGVIGFIENTNIRSTIITNAHERVISNYSISAMTNNYINFYQENIDN